MTTDVIVVGAGLAGLSAALFAADQGASLLLVSYGRGSLGISTGCIDIWKSAAPSRSLPRMKGDHPYALLGYPCIRESIASFKSLSHQAGYELHGKLSENIQLPSPLGTAKLTCLAPTSLHNGCLGLKRPITLGHFQSFRDFSPFIMKKNLERAGYSITSIVDLPLFDLPLMRDAYSTDLAHLFQDASWRDEIIRSWRPHLAGVDRLGIPAVLGIQRHNEILVELENELETKIIEIPTLPPVISGLRLERALRESLCSKQVEIIEGSRAIGRIDGRSRGQQVRGIVLQTTGGPRVFESKSVILATGGLLNGGLVALRGKHVKESVFDLPVAINPDVGQWIVENPLKPQPFARIGIRVDEDMRPLGVDQQPVFKNLFAAGGIIGGSDRSSEGSRQGIDIATAYRAANRAINA
jgi:glycerol-3-phosphate dehydrogenase subunit B